MGVGPLDKFKGFYIHSDGALRATIKYIFSDIPKWQLKDGLYYTIGRAVYNEKREGK
jgi:hypothetical protein